MYFQGWRAWFMLDGEIAPDAAAYLIRDSDMTGGFKD